MNFNLISIFNELRENKLWWVDVVFYFVISSLIAVVFCYLIFVAKVSLQKADIKNYEMSLATVGTDQQKEMEKQVFDFQKKINDYAILIKDQRIFSNILTHLEQNTLPNVWFSRFNTASKDADILLTGGTETVQTFSRQVSVFEESQYLTKITVLGTTLGEKNKIDFNLVLSLDPKIFDFAVKATPGVAQ
ncbi:MAG: hypothetical protein HYT35_01345 [Candidatus Staskawiczbacteria bacterium]|nr:hypothetical protein [Candidatus Staskawiczbacteria bacterium]